MFVIWTEFSSSIVERITLRYFRWVSCVNRTVIRFEGIQVRHHISSVMGEQSSVKTENHIPLVLPGVQANEHLTKSLGDRKPAHAVGDHEQRVETELPERLQPFMEGIFNFDRRISSWHGARPPQPILPSVHPPAKPTSHKAGGKHIFFTHVPKDPNWEVRMCTKITRASGKRNPDDRADSIKIAEKFGDMTTADHKALNEEQESRLHHRCAVFVHDLAHAKPNQLTRRWELFEKSYVQKNTQDPFLRTILWKLLKLVKNWIWIMRDLRRADQKHMGLQNDLYDEWKKELRQNWLSGLQEKW